jgi:hypothetical protein
MLRLRRTFGEAIWFFSVAVLLAAGPVEQRIEQVDCPCDPTDFVVPLPFTPEELARAIDTNCGVECDGAECEGRPDGSAVDCWCTAGGGGVGGH